MEPEASIKIELETGKRREIKVCNKGHSLADELALNSLPLNLRCGQRSICQGCEVELLEGTLLVNGIPVNPPATVKACCSRLAGPVTIRIPARSRIDHTPEIGDTFEMAVPYAHQPLFPFVARQRDTAFAVDVGTTTVVVLLVDLVTGAVLSRAGALNQQIRFGDNVVTRIQAAGNPGHLVAMQHAVVVETILPLLVLTCERAGRSMNRIAGGAIAGNTTMLHLLVGEDPTSLGIAPFTPQFIAGRRVWADDIQLVATELPAKTPVQLLPGIAAYIGADIAAGIYASGMAFDSTPSLLVDIGTNGEIVLQNGGKLFGCATAAGPAFEGCGLRCGTRARKGAVCDLNLKLNPFSLETGVIGGAPLTQSNGLCGTAYLDFLAAGRNSGLLGATGRFEMLAWENLPAKNRFVDDGQRAIRLLEKNIGGPLIVSELDVALLLQAKAAIGAGVEILLETAGINAADVGRVYLAGGFGMNLNVAHAIAIGLLPGFCEEQVRVIGNASLAGTLLALVDRTTLEEMEDLRLRTEVVELNLVDGFESRYVEHLMLP